jgi:hypothetical protein
VAFSLLQVSAFAKSFHESMKSDCNRAASRLKPKLEIPHPKKSRAFVSDFGFLTAFDFQTGPENQF